MFCPGCGVNNPDNPSFCRNCGQALARPGSADARLYAGVNPDEMKRLVIRAARMTRKYGMTPTTIAAWGRLNFKGSTMGIAMGRVIASHGGTGGTITVTPHNGGSRVNIVWDHNNKSCAEATARFWQNLDRLLAPGGLKLGSRSATLNIATALFLIIAAICLVGELAAYAELQTIWEMSIWERQREGMEGVDGYIVGSMIWTGIMFVYATIGAILSLKRDKYTHALGASIGLAAVYGIGLVWIFALGLIFILPYQLVMLALATVTAVCIWKSREDFET
ncbi:MAG: zinc ribbon domain-containing protein [Dehalococcoidia bacterium]|nr:zinc ribbon domain-containing protein [Dehalococcoidia bacterium]